MRLITAILAVIFLGGCGVVPREASADYWKKKYEETDAQFAVGSESFVKEKKAHTKSEELRIEAEKLARKSSDLLTESRQEEQAERVADAKHWDNLFQLVALGFDVIAVALFIFCMLEGWPLKIVAVGLGCVGLALHVCGMYYLAIQTYRVWVLGGSVIGGLGVLWYLLHANAGIVSKVKEAGGPNIEGAAITLRGAAGRAARKWKLIR